MKKIATILRTLFHVEYRLSVYYLGETKPYHHYAGSRREARSAIHSLEDRVNCWTLYKRGPFGLEERVVDFG